VPLQGNREGNCQRKRGEYRAVPRRPLSGRIQGYGGSRDMWVIGPPSRVQDAAMEPALFGRRRIQDHMDVVHQFLRVLSDFRAHNFHVILVELSRTPISRECCERCLMSQRPRANFHASSACPSGDMSLICPTCESGRG
jgi:hypothetical protein